jgi:putative FmdB family regulatory protein
LLQRTSNKNIYIVVLQDYNMRAKEVLFMPMYEYQCGSCGKMNEFLVDSYRNTETKKCGFCGSAKLTKQFSRVNVSSSSGSEDASSCDSCSIKGSGCDGSPGCGMGGMEDL